MRAVLSARRLASRRAWLWRNRRAFVKPGRSAQPKLFVDVSNIIRNDARTGIQRVVRAVWSELVRRDGHGFSLVPVFATHGHGYCVAADLALGGTGSTAHPEPIPVGAGDRFLGLDLSAQFLPRYLRQVRAWRAAGATVHLVVYDLLPLLQPAWFYRSAHLNFQRWFDLLASDSDQAICISGQVSRDLRDRLQASRLKHQLPIAQVRLGGDIAASRPSSGITDEVASLLGRIRFRPTLLMVGTVEPRKGYDVALDAFEQLWRSRREDAPELVIVGKAGWKSNSLIQRISAHPELGRRLRWVGQVSDEALCRLYEECRGVVIASRGEGFGLPLIEAVAHRRHVLARDLPVFREQGLPNVIYFGDDRPALLAECLRELAQAGQVRPSAAPSLPTWRDCVDDLLTALDLPVDCPREDRLGLSAGS